jgi:hypothetical protein
MTKEMVERMVEKMVTERVLALVEAEVEKHRAEFIEAFELERKAAEAGPVNE